MESKVDRPLELWMTLTEGSRKTKKNNTVATTTATNFFCRHKSYKDCKNNSTYRASLTFQKR